MDRGGRRGNSEANSDGKAPLPIAEAARDGAKRPGVAPERRGRDIEVPGPLPVAKDARVLLQRYTVTRLGCALAAGKALAKQKACQKLLQRTHCCGQKHILLARKDALL